MKISEIGKALSNPVRVKILHILSENDLTASEVHKKYNNSFNDDKRRESIYRELEKLVDFSIVDKEYYQEDKKILYSLISERININLSNRTIDRS